MDRNSKLISDLSVIDNIFLSPASILVMAVCHLYVMAIVNKETPVTAVGKILVGKADKKNTRERTAPPLLQVSHLYLETFYDLTFSVAAGECIGIRGREEKRTAN